MSKRHNATGRSKGEPRHVRLYHWFMQTSAWQSLNAVERAIYVEMALRYAGTGSNNGKLHYAVREAVESVHIGKSTAARALQVLQERGFIVPVAKGAFSVKVKLATTWRLTEFPCDVEHKPATKEFTKWSPEIQNTVPPQTSTVSVAGPNGTCNGTEVAEMSRNGPTTGTVKANFAPPRSHHRYTYSLPGGASLTEEQPAPTTIPVSTVH